MANKAHKIFISSTVEDLTPYRDAAESAIVTAEHAPLRNEYWAASGDKPPYAACMKKVEEADALVVIVAHRYGWVPPDQPGKKGYSITRLECLRAVKAKKPVFAFVIDKAHPWLLEHVDRKPEAIQQLDDFKTWLNTKFVRNTFTTAEDLNKHVLHAITIHEWEKQPRPKRARKKAAKKSGPDLEPYLTSLKNEHGHIEIRGLHVGSGKAHRFPIDELYVPLKMSPQIDRRRSDKKTEELRGPQTHPGLEEALKESRVVIVGDPGAGKTTFLRRIAYDRARARLEGSPGSTKSPLPIYIRMGQLSEHRSECRKRRQGPKLNESPAWLWHFLAARSVEAEWGLDEDFFRKAIHNGDAILLLDGLDEAPDRKERAALARMFERAVADHEKCRFVVTTRPRAYEGLAVLSGFAEAQVEPFEPEAVDTFLRHWSAGLFPKNPPGADEHRNELAAALKAKPEIRRMARNPVMLTALAALYWNDKRLPDQRALLYESILSWLLRSRETLPGRAGEETTRERLSRLALKMQTNPKGRLTQAGRRWASEAIAGEFGGNVKEAEAFVAQEEVDSGVITGLGNNVRFWHLTFQEYLAARAVAGQSEREQIEMFAAKERLYDPEWRETTLLFAGVLYGQGKPKVDAFVSAILKKLGKEPSLAKKARCVGLLGAMVQDLRPYGYAPADPLYKETLDAVMAIFDSVEGQKIDLRTRIDAADALALAGDPRFADPEANWVRIPAGTFWMGAQKANPTKPNYDKEADDDAAPVHEVKLSAFEIGRYPVTVGEYQRFIDDGGYQKKEFWGAGGFRKSGEAPKGWDDQQTRPTRPVIELNWYEAAAYCVWAGGRLLTEAEWERAARGKDGRNYCWGDETPYLTRANFTAGQGTPFEPTPVGLFPLGATPEGLQDMAGNVDEWCSDWYGGEYYGTSPKSNPKGPANGDSRVIRGGSWINFTPKYLRCSNRLRYDPDLRVNSLGFRCVREVFP